MRFLKKFLQELSFRFFQSLRSGKGQTMIEYALVAVFIAIVLIFIFFNPGIKSGISGAGSKTASALQQ
jgi:Flp pilus assembly pilin Flp